jgi:hypothetical protein
MSLRARSSALLGAVVVLVAALGGCVTPSVPIPPPEPAKMSFEVDEEEGTARFVYAADASYGLATVYVFNRDRGVGIIETARVDGSVGPTAPFEGVIGDHLIVSFELAGQLSAVCVELRPGQSSPAYQCNL